MICNVSFTTKTDFCEWEQLNSLRVEKVSAECDLAHIDGVRAVEMDITFHQNMEEV